MPPRKDLVTLARVSFSPCPSHRRGSRSKSLPRSCPCVGTHMAWHLLAIAVASLPLLASLRASLPFPSREFRGASRPRETPLTALFAEVLRRSVLGNLRACFAKFRVTCGGAVSHLPEQQQGHRRRRRLSSRRGRGPGRRWSHPSLLRVSMRAAPSASRSVRYD
jgi:hypothetical protein